jgi:hypothetical protein
MKTAFLRLLLLPGLLVARALPAAELTPEIVAGFDRYVARTEARIEGELSATEGFLVQDFLPKEERAEAARTIAAGGIFTRKLRTLDEDGSEIEIPGGLVHHWVGSVLVPGVRLEDVVGWLQRYDQHDRYFADVERSRLLARDGNEFDISLRLRRKKVVTVTYETEHHVRYRSFGRGREVSESHSTRIAELENADTPREREKPDGEDRGFLWRLDSYWRFEQVRQGVVVECESVSLSRGVPAALRWLVGRYLDSVPRESLESTLVPIRALGSEVPAVTMGTTPDKASPKGR